MKFAEFGKISIREATEVWVTCYFDAIQTGILQELNQYDPLNPFDPVRFREVTVPTAGDRVIVCATGESGEIDDYDEETEVYRVFLDFRQEMIQLKADEFEIECEDYFPMWGTMWSFRDRLDEYWLEERGGIRAMSQCGFRIYKHVDYGYFFGIDGAGYNFYEAHWIPLYKARGLHWHKEEEEK